jgi:Protein of unknown function (DUF5663)
MTITDQSLLDVLGLDELTPEEQKDALEDVGSLIFEGTVVRMLADMELELRDEFSALMDSNASEEEVLAFLKEKVPGADQAVEDTMAELRDDLLALQEAQ